jgi:uroporphyrinogen decarboxylase
MSRRENFYKSMNHIQPDDIIMDLGGCPLSGMEGRSMYTLLEFLGFDIPENIDVLRFGKVRRLDERLLKYFDIDTRSVGEIFLPKNSLYEKITDKEYIDEWGIRRIYTGLYWEQVDYPLKGATVEDLDKFRWPDPESVDLKEIEQCAIEAKRLFEETDYIICAEHPVYGVFELGCWMCGFDDFLVKMIMDLEFVEKFFNKIYDYQKKVIEVYYSALGKYIHYTSSGDDFATQSSLFVSEDMFSQLIKPYLKERIAFTKKFTDAFFLHHSCGSVFPLIGELIDSGVEILNPIQPKAALMHPANLKSSFGDKIVFHGGIDTQELLPFGNKDIIEENIKSTIDILNKNGGYIFAGAHNIQEDVPPQNLVYMFEAGRKFGKRSF